MVLPMARPQRDPTSGTYYLRLRPPRSLPASAKGSQVLLPVGGQHFPITIGDIIKLSLRTKDPAEARARYSEAHGALLMHFEGLSSGPVHLTMRQVSAIAGTIYRDLIDKIGDDPGEPEIWTQALLVHGRARLVGKLEKWFGPLVDEELGKLALRVDDWSRTALLDAVEQAVIHQAQVLLRHSEGDFSPDPDANRYADMTSAFPAATTETSLPQPAPTKSSGHMDFLGLWWRYRETVAVADSTARRWKPAIEAFANYLGDRTLSDVTAADALLFADERVRGGISPRSAHTVDLAAVKRMFSFAHTRGMIPMNPFAGLRRERIDEGKAKGERDGKGFAPDELRVILSQSLAIGSNPGQRSDTMIRALRWVPWIQAYSGARPGEIIQLRKDDFGIEQGIHYLIIRDSAGTVKTGQARRVPIHDHLVELGLLDFVSSAPYRHLFINAGDETETALVKGIAVTRGRLSSWVRDIGITDPHISPNHAWRHTFNTIAEEAGISERVYSAICGWSETATSRKYGSVTLAARATAIKKFPRYVLP